MKYSRWKWWALYALLIGLPTIPNHGWQGVRAGIILGLYWALFTPVILRTVRAQPFSRTTWLKPALLHLLFIMVSALATTILDVFIVVLGAWPAADVDIDPAIGQSIAVTLPIYLGIVAVATILDTQLRLANVQRDVAEARLQALRAQLNPHFLFNALNTVAMAVRRADREEALQVVLDLSTLLRTVLRRTNTELVRLSDEIEFIERYLDIEKVRFRRELRTEWEIDERARNAAVPSMILQPVIENALRHGAGKQAQASRIRFSASARNGRLDLTIEDDGPGFAEGWREGVGLSNVRKRLALLYAERASLQVDNTGPGASVRLSLPFGEMPDAEIQDTDRR